MNDVLPRRRRFAVGVERATPSNLTAIDPAGMPVRLAAGRASAPMPPASLVESAAAGVREGLPHWVALLDLWRQRSRQRRQLAALGDWQLRDIGITREEAEREAAKPFWR